MSYYINDNVIEKVKDSANIVDIVEDYLELKKTGANYVGLCPFHSEKTPSFTVSEPKQFFHCFGCGESGDSISFIMKKENLEFPEAVKFLADRLGIEIEEKKLDEKYVKERDRAYEINREAARFFYSNLIEKPEVLDYLYNRGLKKPDINRFGLGFALDSWDSLKDFMVKKGYKEDELEKIGLIAKRKNSDGYYDRFRNRIIFPIIDSKNRVIGFGGRVLDENMPKYLNSKETIVFNKGSSLYGLNLIKKHSNRSKILLVEGYMDVISLSAKGINFSVASLGTALTKEQAKLLKRYGKEVYISFDSDTAGIKASLKAVDILLEEDVKPKVLLLPKGMDPDDYINKFGLIKFQGLFKDAMEYIDYKIHIKKNEFDLEDTNDKIQFTLEVADLIKSLKSSIEQDVYIKKISKETGISIEAIKDEIKASKYNNKKWVNEYSRHKYKNTKINPIDKKIVSGYLKAELDLLKFMIYHRDYYENISNKIEPKDFYSKDTQTIYEIIYKLYSKYDTIDLEQILGEVSLIEFHNKDIINHISNFEFEYEPTKTDEILDDLINTITFSNLQRRREEIVKNIESLEKKINKTEVENLEFKNLCLELTRLDSEIKTITN